MTTKERIQAELERLSEEDMAGLLPIIQKLGQQKQGQQKQGQGPAKSAVPGADQGGRMAAALEQLAQSGTLAGMDAVQWQKETRADRPLPGRDE